MLSIAPLPVDDRDVGAAARQSERDGPSDTPAAAGDDGAAALQIYL